MSSEGVIKWWNDEKGYGFITPKDGSEEVFLHFKAVNTSGFPKLKQGQKVWFDVRQHEKRLHAENVNVDE